MTDSSKEPSVGCDEIVAEVRRVRQELMADAGNDLRAFAERLRSEQAASGHDVVSRPPRTIDETPEEAA